MKYYLAPCLQYEVMSIINMYCCVSILQLYSYLALFYTSGDAVIKSISSASFLPKERKGLSETTSSIGITRKSLNRT